MKSFIAATLAAIALAQEPAASTTKTYTQSVYEGTSDGQKMTISTQALGVSTDAAGTLTIVQTIDIPTLARYNVVQSWISFMGAADDGKNVMAIGNAINTTRPITMQSFKACGMVGDNYARAGYNSIRTDLTSTNCSLAVQQAYKQIKPTQFQHSAIAPFSKEKTQSTLLMGASQSLRVGVTVYVNPGGSTPAQDSFKSGFVMVRADNALALAMSGTAAALAAMTF